MSNKPRILYVEDDANLAFVTRDNLEENGYVITHCTDGDKALKAFNANIFDLCILDIMLPKTDGFTVAIKIREKNHHIPILFLTAKNLNEDKIQGFKTGADDYITKPFSIDELVLKIEVFLKRNKVNVEQELNYTLGKHLFVYNNLSLKTDEEETRLTQKEGDLLLFLCKNLDQVVRREEILMQIWGKDDYFLGRSLDVFISRLRKYLRDSATIETIHGVGFKMSAI